MGLCLIPESPDITAYENAGLTYMLAWKPHRSTVLLERTVDQHMPWIGKVDFNPQSYSESEFEKRVDELINRYPGNVGWLVNDEPPFEEMQITGKLCDMLRRNYRDKLIFSNLGGDPNYAEHIQHFLKLVRPDVLMFDRYPFSPTVDGIDEPEKYFRSIGEIRQAALKAHLPYWAFVQSVDRSGPSFKFAFPYYSESDVRMQVFTYLTYGFSGLAYFTYDYWSEKKAAAFIDANGRPSHIYHAAAKANREARILGDAIKRLTSTGVFAVPSPANIAPPVSPEVLPPWNAGADGSTAIRSIEMLEPGPNRHGIIGFFQDDRGERYFMLTNLWREHIGGQRKGSAEETRLTFRVCFSANVATVTRLDRETGQAVAVSIDDPEHGILLKLPGGTGDLFRIGAGEFPISSEDQENSGH